ncbi:Ammonia transport outward protein 2 [Spathaspora sp. JA1]|nr:Ammonia transport outward protein 2 [Spathaspora sp. JA1]
MSSDKNIPSSSSTSSIPYRTCSITNEDEFVVIGNERHYKGDIEKEKHCPPPQLYGNAGAVALIATSFNGLIAGFYLAGAMDVTILNAAVGLMFFYGGLVQFLCGIWEMVKGNTFGATVFISFGCWWIQLGSTFVPAFGIRAAYGDDVEMFDNAMGLMILGWGMFAFMMFICTLKANFTLSLAILTLDITLLLTSAGFLCGADPRIFRAAGIVSIINCFIGWYEAFGAIATSTNAYFEYPTYPIPVVQGQKRLEGDGRCAEY